MNFDRAQTPFSFQIEQNEIKFEKDALWASFSYIWLNYVWKKCANVGSILTNSIARKSKFEVNIF